MQRNSVKSSLLESVGYDSETKTLELSFKPRKDGEAPKVYRYSGVSEDTYRKFTNAPSLGKFYLSEEWKPVRTVPDLEASSLGRIRITRHEGKTPTGGTRSYEGKAIYGVWDGKRFIVRLHLHFFGGDRSMD